MMLLMDNAPYDFVQNHTQKDLNGIAKNIHRTFMAEDFIFFIKQLKKMYSINTSLEEYFILKPEENNYMLAIDRFRNVFLEDKTHRAKKHISSPIKGSAAKRINMFLRWMVRNDAIDFGVWKQLTASKLSIPLDIHTANVARKLNILNRKQNDKKAVIEIDSYLRQLDSLDPVKYDFALFGLGVYEDF